MITIIVLELLIAIFFKDQKSDCLCFPSGERRKERVQIWVFLYHSKPAIIPVKICVSRGRIFTIFYYYFSNVYHSSLTYSGTITNNCSEYQAFQASMQIFRLSQYLMFVKDHFTNFMKLSVLLRHIGKTK